MANIKKWNGSGWEDIRPKKWDGSSWIEPEIKKWNGSGWEILNQQQYSNTWSSTWTQSYVQHGHKRTDYRANKLTQGAYSTSAEWGIESSLAGFGDIQSSIAGSRIDRVELYLRAEHWWYYSGGTAVIGYHNHPDEPDEFSHSVYGAKWQSFSARGQAKWIVMPNALGEGIRDGYYKGISTSADSFSKTYYGVFNGAWDGYGYAPMLKITYTK